MFLIRMFCDASESTCCICMVDCLTRLAVILLRVSASQRLSMFNLEVGCMNKHELMTPLRLQDLY